MRKSYIDETNDKQYFTIIPNYIANHSSANDQALYFQMKKIVGEKSGICYASEKYFKDKLKIGSKALKKSIKYLLDHNWIKDAGIREIQTAGGVQESHCYVVVDIWEININHYQGVSKREPLNTKGVSESNPRGVQKEQRGSLPSNKEEPNKNIEEEHTLFDIFYKEYPKKVAKSVALKSFTRLKVNDTLLKVILSDIERRKKSDQWKKNDGKFIQYPATYLNQKRWEDEDNNKESLKDKIYGYIGGSKKN